MTGKKNIDLSNLEIDGNLGFFKQRELFGWTDPNKRAQAWTACLKSDAKAFALACEKLKTLDFNHGPSGLSLLGLVLEIENGSDELDSPMLRLALSRGASPSFPINAQGEMALSRCASEGRIDAALLLIDKGAGLEEKNQGGISLGDLLRRGDKNAKRIVELSKIT